MNSDETMKNNEMSMVGTSWRSWKDMLETGTYRSEFVHHGGCFIFLLFNGVKSFFLLSALIAYSFKCFLELLGTK